MSQAATATGKVSKPSGRYLSTAAIRALASSMALVSSVLGFEIVEVWSEAEENNFHCTYVHAEEGIVEKYPNIITGYYPQHKRKHMLSPKVKYFFHHNFDFRFIMQCFFIWGKNYSFVCMLDNLVNIIIGVLSKIGCTQKGLRVTCMIS